MASSSRARTTLLGTGLGVADEVHQLGCRRRRRPVRSSEVGRGEPVQLGGLGVELLALGAGGAEGGPEAGRAVAGEADEAGLLVEGPADGLADPEGGVGGELEALAPVELVDGVLEAEVALLDQVEELHARGQRVAAGDADDEAQVGPDEPVLGGGGVARRPCAARGRAARRRRWRAWASRPFSMIWESSRSSCGVEEGHLADLVEVQADGIAHGWRSETPWCGPVIPPPCGRVCRTPSNVDAGPTLPSSGRDTGHPFGVAVD